MQKRMTLSEISHHIYKMNGTKPREVTFDFLEKWLRAEGPIFLFERTPGWGHPEIFHLAPGPSISGTDEHQFPIFLDMALDRSAILRWLHSHSPQDKLLQMEKVIGEEADQGVFDCSEHYHFSANDLHREHWELLQRISISLPLAFRYCWYTWKQVPSYIKTSILESAPQSSSRGQKPNYKTTKKDTCQYLDVLLETNLIQLRPDGKNDAVELIRWLWNPDHKPSALYKHIERMFP